MVKFTRILTVFILLADSCEVFTEKSRSKSPADGGVHVQCGESRVRITVKRQFFKERRIPFKPEFIRLGFDSMRKSSCGPERPVSQIEMVISTRLQDCGFESRVRDKWLVYSSQLLLFPAVLPTSTGSLIVRGATTVIPVECYYERKQTVIGDPVVPTWVPMTSTMRAFGFLHFSIHIMADDCTSQRSSSVYQQGAAVFFEARVEAPLHPTLTLYVDSCVATLKPDASSAPSYKFISKHGCLMDSVFPGSPSRFLPRNQDNRLCFSLRTFRFNQTSEEQMFISCHLRAAVKQRSHNHLNKACFFDRRTFRWRATEGDSALCECCDSDCGTEEKNVGHPVAEEMYEADRTAGPFYTWHHSNWAGRLSVN
ncbi:zona pellucida sperm-binding protein 3 isoform X1 [Nothobranchius furzeri]|uniref:Zona pellucida sperm-binding protein 3 n=4 Tax=Nothobranchius furzeri TaxID=105023 RepID=A0A8C6NHZ7_NOTFU|nr:zona pellucida sperm-binding protein 3-like [Nothobranchius furzeri]